MKIGDSILLQNSSYTISSVTYGRVWITLNMINEKGKVFTFKFKVSQASNPPFKVIGKNENLAVVGSAIHSNIKEKSVDRSSKQKEAWREILANAKARLNNHTPLIAHVKYTWGVAQRKILQVTPSGCYIEEMGRKRYIAGRFILKVEVQQNENSSETSV